MQHRSAAACHCIPCALTLKPPPSHSTGASVDKAASFYVGDAAGREKDHSDSDLLFAKAAGLRFFTEDAFFDSSAQHPL
jgi:hypothetical protein